MQALEQAIEIIQAQETWSVQDDLCDCVYQRMGYWNNPYIGETYEVRFCCIWAEFEKMWPQFFKRSYAEPAEWNGEFDMPKAIWHRQLSAELGMPLSQVRDMGLEPPKGQPHRQKPVFYLPWSGEYVPVTLG